MAAAVAKLTPRTDFNLDLSQSMKKKMDASKENGLYGEPVADPNWMRGFYDEYDPNADFRERHAGSEYQNGDYDAENGSRYLHHDVPLDGKSDGRHQEARHMHFSMLQPHIHETLRDYHEPVHHEPVHHAPVHHEPVHHEPVRHEPVYHD